MTQFYLGLGLIAVAAIIGFYGTQIAREGWTKSKELTRPQVEQTSDVSQEIATLDKRIENLSDALTRTPSIDNQTQLTILQGEHDRLAEKSELTQQDKRALQDQAITLGSLELGRKQALQQAELEDRQRRIANRQAEIQREKARREGEELLENQQRQLADKLIPSCRYALTKLYDMLQGIAKESSIKLASDFPGKRPTLEQSNLVKDGKLVSAEHVIRLGSEKEWEFRVRIEGTPQQKPNQPVAGTWKPYFTVFKIQAGASYVTIAAPNPMMRKPFLSATFAGETGEHAGGESSFTDYQKPIDQALKALIQDRYNAKPLKAK